MTPGEPFTLTRTRWGGSLLEDATLAADVKLLTLQPHAVRASPAEGAGARTVETFTPSLSDADLLVRVTERVERAATGSRSPTRRSSSAAAGEWASADGFAALEELAELLHGRWAVRGW